MKILYSQCWEDSDTLQAGLHITNDDDILSVASGGDNSLALLLDNPHSIIAVDRNFAQIALVELKIAAIKILPYETYIQFLGVRPSSHRIDVYKRLRHLLSENSRKYWDDNFSLIEQGVIHIGKFENYFALFRKYLLPLIHSDKTIEKFLSIKSIEKQKEFYSQTWNNWKWRCMFHLFFSKFILSRFGRTSSFFEHVTEKNISKVLFIRSEHGLRDVFVENNYYLNYILTGNYNRANNLPPYLQKENFTILKSRINRIKLICGDLETVMNSLPVNSISKFNLSDTFEYMNSDTKQKFLQSIIRVSRSDAKLAVWTLFIKQTIPIALKKQISERSELTKTPYTETKTFFYDKFHVWEMKKALQ